MPRSSAPAPRLPAIDATRGLIMALMALDHARAFVAREHPFEYWAEPLPTYDSALPFLTRLATHFCAPGFFFLMGVGMTLLASSRRRSGWSEARIAGYFVRRGVVLLLVEQFLENPAWLIGSLGAAETFAPSSLTPSGDGPVLALGVLYALALSMILWSALTRGRPVAVFAFSLAAVFAAQILLPSQSESAVAFSPLSRILLVPGHTGILFVLYPLLPWLGLTGFGIAFGHGLDEAPEATARRSLSWGAIAIALFVGLRLAGGFGNIHQPVPPGWIGFLNVTKYPPSLAFDLLTLGVDLLLLAAFSAADSRLARASGPLLVFGRSALFFYIVHLYLYALIGFGFPHGSSLAAVYPVWLAGLVVLYPLCHRYARFKLDTPPDSLWRLF